MRKRLKNYGMDEDHQPGHGRLRLRWAGIGLGFFFMLWLPVEDLDAAYVVGLAAGVCAWLGGRFLFLKGKRVGIGLYLAAGFVAGLAVAPLAAFLMVFKGGLHAHGFQDFSIGQLLLVLRAAPWWGAAGVAAGAGLGLARLKINK